MTAPRTRGRGPVQAQHVIALICFFLSGFSGLVYEVAWIRKASLVFGATTFAVSTVLAVFFLGLSCGSYLFGRIGQRISRPLRLYDVISLEVGQLHRPGVAFFYTADFYHRARQSVSQP